MKTAGSMYRKETDENEDPKRPGIRGTGATESGERGENWGPGVRDHQSRWKGGGAVMRLGSN